MDDGNQEAWCTQYWVYALSILARLNKYFKLKPSSIGDPTMNLSATVKKMTLDNGVSAWASSPAKYV